jgi:hypothetical protein
MDNKIKDLLRKAFDGYLATREEGGLRPSQHYVAYDLENLDHIQWQNFSQLIVQGEVRELINLLNHWHGSLLKWDAWNRVISPYDQEDTWELRTEFLEACARDCLFQPSKIRDTFTFVATNSMHQIHLHLGNDYRDFLDGDLITPGENPKHLTRKKKEKRLSKLTSMWPEEREFMVLLRKLDDKDYQRQTSDYRNRTSHTIGPRLGIGITREVTRWVSQAEKLAQHDDGTFILESIEGKVSVNYGLGGTEPIDLHNALESNLEQYQIARNCYAAYRKLLATGLDSITAVQSPR